MESMPMHSSLQNILDRIRKLQETSRRILVTMDGPCASGKSTLARILAEASGGYLLHTDDFVVPHPQKTPERLAIPGGNCDWERLVGEVLSPWQQREPVSVRKYLFRDHQMSAPELLPDADLLILEGSYCNLPAIREYASLRLFVDTMPTVRRARLEKRESAESLRRFDELWIPLENAYFEAYHLPDKGCLLISGA
ncbi:MAG: (d)CMP kinase [Clostridia bacterium]|nr:(d)CMP kinase [Clostridia bacterium]